ncbi:2-oxoacid:acceptor oxidoreductase family protein [Glycomyces harbinensis]|uniref:Pyruvate ferredoxin oxidoreductase gamma subunit n=1 Tax=Glycomyces harbinensis TaxID=58114 RepID=A0A1G6XNP6_9ACTN|nr:2-oxoacid:acceptor oxidoreductase family protein [Glycomyces harbinensis]SDD78987.1 pyruvate ferredoxin oxidoreductase gamma subunit [Glycomyces harbinensis]
MFAIRIHGRGGQGVVTAAEMLSQAAFLEGKFAQAVPSFGSERTGAPVVAYCRIADCMLRGREPVARPDALIIQDPTLRFLPEVFEGMPVGGYLLVNSARPLAELGIGDRLAGLRRSRVASLDASRIARSHLGRPLPNTALLGGFAALSGVLSLDSIAEAFRQRFDDTVAEANVRAAFEAYRLVAAQRHGREQLRGHRVLRAQTARP